MHPRLGMLHGDKSWEEAAQFGQKGSGRDKKGLEGTIIRNWAVMSPLSSKVER